MKTILILGGFGFIGTNLLNYIDRLMQNNYNVIVFDKQQAHPLGLKFKCVSKVYWGDFGNYHDVEQIFKENVIYQVFHFLNSTVPATSSDIRFDVESNLLATCELLKIMQNYKVNNIVFISSGGAIYGNTHGSRNMEKEDTFPTSSYGIVKLAIEKYICMFNKRNNLSYLILRLSNPYGPFHDSTRQGIINIAIRKAIRRETLTIWGNGSNRKDYIFVEDFINILMKLITKGINNEIINIGSGYLYSINEIIEKVKSFEPSLCVEYADNKEFDNMSFKLNTSKLNSYIKDLNFTSLDEGMKKTYKWVNTYL